MDWCAANGYTPKFDDFTVYDKDGKYVPQREVRAVFPKADNAFGSMKELMAEGLQEDAIIQGKRDSSLSSIVNEIEKSLPKTEAEIEQTEVEQADRDVEADAIGQRQYSFRGINKDGIEVYETSEEIKALSYNERKKHFLDVMINEYRGRTAKFVRNGHAYYATFDEDDVNKNIYGDKRSDSKGWKAKINTGAEGNIFELVENAKYNGSKPEEGKKTASHKDVGYWDYFIKNVQIDGTVFKLTANVRKKPDGAFVYSIQLNQNKKTEASPPLGLLLKALDGVPNTSGDIVSQDVSASQVQKQRRTQSYTDREMLEMAAEDVGSLKLSEGEKTALDIFNKRLDEVKKLEEQRDEQRRILAELNKAEKPDEAEIRKTKGRLSLLGKLIKNSDKKTAMRHKVQDIVKELDTYLRKGTKYDSI